MEPTTLPTNQSAPLPMCGFSFTADTADTGASILALAPLPMVAPVPAPIPAHVPTLDELPELLSAEQVAGVLGVSLRTVWRMLERKEIPEPIRWNRKLVKWHKAELQAWLLQRRAAA